MVRFLELCRKGDGGERRLGEGGMQDSVDAGKAWLLKQKGVKLQG